MLTYSLTKNRGDSNRLLRLDYSLFRKNGGTLKDSFITLLIFISMKTFLPFRYLSLLVCLCCLQSVFSATEISVNWNYGYVGSSSNSGYKNKLNTNGKYYSYSDVITLKEAGTKIYFTDNKTGFASAAAYVISSWKKNSADEWVIDLDSPNYPGDRERIQRHCTSGRFTSHVCVYLIQSQRKHSPMLSF
jgi:hypothetical protein